jgi:hypothetical protein
MTTEEHQRLRDIRKRTLDGQHVSDEENAFCDKMWRDWPAEWQEVDVHIQKWARHRMNQTAEDSDAER